MSNYSPDETGQGNLEYWMMLNDFEEVSGKYHARSDLNKDNIKNIFDASQKIKSVFWDKADISAYRKLRVDLGREGVRIVKHDDSDYPVRLKKYEKSPPLVLYIWGALRNFDNCVAIVGSRNSSHYARKKTRELSQYLAKHGYTVVAGLALGIDTEAHCGALDIEGKTVAVIPNIGEITPSSNRRLAEDIMRNGALLSAGSPIIELSKYNYVRRNRIISGISKCLVVMEASESHGTDHQVEFAINQGVKVFALKHRPDDDKAFFGFDRYAKMGAIPFTSGEEILTYLEDKNGS
jgi:DNA processing protein